MVGPFCRPWGSIAMFRHDDEKVHRLIGPVMWHKDQWYLPAICFYDDPDVGLSAYRKESLSLVKSCGLGPRTSLTK